MAAVLARQLERRIERNRRAADLLDERWAAMRQNRKQAKAPLYSDVPTSFESPESSAIAGANYDPDTETLTVELRRGPNVTKAYRCAPFPMVQWSEFLASPSKGQHFNRHIRPLYALAEVG